MAKKKSAGIAMAEYTARSGGRLRKGLDEAIAGSSLSPSTVKQHFNKGVNISIDKMTDTKSVPATWKGRSGSGSKSWSL